ncbi:MAG: L,D-transpeptidase family protein [Bacteroidota bacterium]|nr:L,D-transpeptidase family protein [Bacteroidota bacterium]
MFFIFSCFAANSFALRPDKKADFRKEDSLMVQKFYATYNEPLFWLTSRKDIKRANEWLNAIESTDNSDFVSDKLQTEQIRSALSLNFKKMDNFLKEKTDRQLTVLVLNFIKYHQQNNILFEYDEVNIPQDSVYIFQLIFSKHKGSVSNLVSTFDCKDPDYLVLKKFMHDSIPDKNSVKYKTVLLAMNYRKYLTANHHPEYILVNIPEAEATYYKNSLPALKMRTVPGKKTNPTPTISSYITSIVTFPHWNVPFDIAVKELLPKIQKDANYLEQHNFDVVDGKGNVLNDSELDWNSYTAKNFPYFFRQSTGSDNSLGVLKFNLQNPFSIFLHATSNPEAFKKDFRFLSHGCIRLEKPFELADAMLRGKIDIDKLKTGKKNTESKIIKLPKKIPVFIIYVPVTVAGNKVTFLPDVYGLIK